MVKKVFVSSKNPHYKVEIEDAKQRFLGRKPTPAKKREACQLVFRYHVRVIGLCAHGGKMALRFLPAKLVPKSARPPVENTEEVVRSGLLQQVKKRGKHACSPMELGHILLGSVN